MTATGRRIVLGAGGAIAALFSAGAAQAGGCNCTKPAPPPPPTNTCGCTTPQQGGGQYGGRGGNGWGYGSGVGYGSSSSSANSSSSADVSVSVKSSAYSNSTAQAAAYGDVFANSAASGNASSSGVVYNGGGGSSFYVEQGSNGVIPNLQVEGVESRVCAEYRAEAKIVAVEATCLDDKDVPHPASQVIPDRNLPPGYEGEVYRCIAGARMQYTLGTFAAAANFDHGQTITCGKNMALYHSASGELACRVQKPARDCNERSLLRRYGAGIKVLKIAAERQCVSYRGEQVAGQSSPGNMVLDGGVGGVVH